MRRDYGKLKIFYARNWKRHLLFQESAFFGFVRALRESLPSETQVDTFLVMFCTRVLEHTQTGRHRAQRGSAAHDVFAEAHVNVSDREEAERVHQHVVRRTDCLSITEQLEDPTKVNHPAAIPTPVLREERKTGDDDAERTQNEEAKHGQLRQRVVASVFRSRLT